MSDDWLSELVVNAVRPEIGMVGAMLYYPDHTIQHAGVVFATRERPVAGTRGDYRVTMRHGVSTITHGHRMTLGIIFHDAR